ncbi:MAG: hypothetical protein ACI4QW_06520, partial [Clostridia bacterium]
MSCVDFDFYSCIYGGTTVPREVFGHFARRAGVLLDSMLRTEPEASDPDRIKTVLCEICDRLYREDCRFGISQESVDGYAVSYSDSAGSEIVQLVRQELGGTGALYRGRRL